MPLKPDEEFVKRCLLEALNAKDAGDGEDPPDIYLELDSKRIAVEITRLTPVSFSKDGELQNRTSQDSFAVDLCDELDSSLGKDVPPDIDILLILYVPVEHGRKYKKELKAFLKDYIKSPIKPGDAVNTMISGAKVKVSVISRRAHSAKKIVGAVVNQNSNAHILGNAEATLADRIKVKTAKCKDIQHNGPIWLALFNDYWLADDETYAQALKMTNLAHRFERIYLVMDTGAVHQLF